MSSKHHFATFGRYSHAIVVRVPDTFREGNNTQRARAKIEHEEFTKLLRSLDLDVLELQADSSLPDSVYVGDTAFVVNGTALICRPGDCRSKEIEIIRSILNRELDLAIMEIADPKAKLDGGDILYTGREIFVGVSVKTNLAGALAVASAFPEFSVTPINVPNKVPTLKCCVSMAGPDIIAVSDSCEAKEILRRIASEASYPYTTITVHDNESANALYINGTLVHRAEFPQSVAEFEAKVDYRRAEVSVFELCKGKASLSSLCLLIKKNRTKHTMV